MSADTSILRVIAGSGRSGTTWVLDAMADANRLRPVFEPLHRDHSRVSLENADWYLTRNDERQDLERMFSDLATNKTRSIWTSYRSVSRDLRRVHGFSRQDLGKFLRRWSTFARRVWTYRERERRAAVLIKCIRANLMLDWLHSAFDARIVLLMRHPCAVVESQLRFPEAWNPYSRLSKYRADNSLMSGPLSEYSQLLSRSMSQTQALATIWCVENLVPASQAAANGYCVVFYEDLLEQPETEWRRLADGLELDSTPDADTLRRPSQQAASRLAGNQSGTDTFAPNRAPWRERLSDEAVEEIGAVLESFGIDFYSVSADIPDHRSFDERLRAAIAFG